MNPETPILMITLQIPVEAETNAEQVLEMIAPQLAEALEQIKKETNAPDPESIPQPEFNISVLKESEESYSDHTRDNLLAMMGYAG